MDFFEKAKGFMLEPSKTFDATKEEKLGEVIKYYAVNVVIFSALFTVLLTFIGSTIISSPMEGRLVGLIRAGAGAGGTVIFFVVFMMTIFIGAFIGGAIFHIFVYLVGGRKGIGQTIKSVMYGSTPGLLLGWIPFIGSFAGIWVVVVELIGIRQLHELTTGKVILAMIIEGVIITVIIAAVIPAFSLW